MELKDKDEQLKEQASFKKFKGSINKIYSDDRTIVRAAGGRVSYYDPSKVKSRDQLLSDLVSNLSDPTKAAKISETLVGINGIYSSIIEYLTNIPLYRYTVIPGQVKKLRETGSADKYAAVYEKMISVVDGISIEVTLPKILQAGLIYGIIYLYIDKDQKSETVETLMLPHSYCQKGFSTNFGTDTIIFDFKFFSDTLGKLRSSSGMTITEDDLFALFPAGLINQYKQYLKNKDLRYQNLPPEYSAAISFSPNGMPPKIYSNFGLIDYDTIKENEVTRSANELEKILSHQIPHNSDGELMFDLEEAAELHNSMAKAISSVAGLKLLTTFGPTEILELQPERTKENKAVQQAYANVFNTAGINPELFIGDSADALKNTLKKDTAYVFKQLNLIINFYNLAINNLYSFSPYQLQINLLPISVYDEVDKVNMYINNANFGIGKLEAVVATGIKQKDISDKHTLEKYLDLDSILVPLQSAYTSTPGDVQKDDSSSDPQETGGGNPDDVTSDDTGTTEVAN